MAKAKKDEEARSVIHPKKTAVFRTLDSNEGPISSSEAKDLLGWVEVEGKDYLLEDRDGKKVSCTNNYNNRPFQASLADGYAQEILRKRWRVNGEPLIIGRTGLTLAAQHRLIGLVFAAQEWQKNAKEYPDWQTEPDLETLLVQGIDETDDVVNTIDTGRPRSLADVLYRSPEFAKYKPNDRKVLSKMTENAIKELWHRTGACNDAYTPRRTHAESIDWLHRHPKLVKAVVHIYEENAEGAVSKHYVSSGTAAGLLYLMGVSGSDGEKYRNAYPPSEKKCDFKRWDKACEFWTLLASGSPQFEGMRKAFAALVVDEASPITAPRDHRIAVLVNAWNEYVSGGKLTPANLKPDSTAGVLDYVPNVGGIDVGDPENPSDEGGAEEPKETPKPKAVPTPKLKAEKEPTSEANGTPVKKSPPKPKVKPTVPAAPAEESAV